MRDGDPLWLGRRVEACHVDLLPERTFSPTTLADASTDMIELRGQRIFGIPYRNRRALKPIAVLDGTIVEIPTKEERMHAPQGIQANREIPGTDTFLGFVGVYLMPSGDVAAVYGAGTQPLG